MEEKMNFFDVFLNVLAVLGIIALGAFIIVFLSDLLISIVDGSNGIFFRRASKKKVKKSTSNSRPKLLPPAQEEKEDEPEELEEEFDGIDYEKARQEEEELRRIAAEKEAEDAERARLIRQRRREFEQQPVEEDVILAPAPKQEAVNIVASKEKNSQTKLEESFDEVALQAMKDMDADAEAEEAKKLEEELKAEQERAASEQENLRKQYEEEINKLREEVHKGKEEVAKLQEELSNKEVVTEAVPVAAGSKEEIEAQLAVLRQRLKENEKEFSINKKDYLPLRRVAVTLDSDKKKLRRKEAIVAKKKVQLYGVNNYVDIDEEKAKELAEELDLLEGLKLSVAHCEEVMNANKDRYPILERTHNILKRNVDALKEDIAELENRLAALEDEGSDKE